MQIVEGVRHCVRAVEEGQDPLLGFPGSSFPLLGLIPSLLGGQIVEQTVVEQTGYFFPSFAIL